MPKYKNYLYPFEWEIMNIIWEGGGKTTVRDVLESGFPDGEKAYTTVQTVMNTLAEKGFLKKEKIGMVNFYKPVKTRTESINKETKGFMERVFGGSFQEMASYLLGTESLSEEEVKIVKKLINNKEQDLKESKK